MVGHERRETARVALPDGTNLPCAGTPIDLDGDDDGLGRQTVDGVVEQRIALCVGHIRSGRCGTAEAARRILQGDDGADLFDVGGDLRQCDRKLCRLSCLARYESHTRAGGLIEEDEIGVGPYLAVGSDQECRQVSGCGELYGNDHIARSDRTVLALHQRLAGGSRHGESFASGADLTSG